MQPEPTHPVEDVQPASPVSEASVPPAKKGNLGWLVTLLLGLLILGLAGVNAWQWSRGNTVKNDLAARQAEIADLQGKYDDLKGENEALTAEAAQISADIEQTTAKTEDAKAAQKSAKSDLTEAQNQATLVKKRLENTSKLMDVITAIYVTRENDEAIARKVINTGDIKAVELFGAFVANPTTETLEAFTNYIYETIAANLKK